MNLHIIEFFVSSKCVPWPCPAPQAQHRADCWRRLGLGPGSRTPSHGQEVTLGLQTAVSLPRAVAHGVWPQWVPESV